MASHIDWLFGPEERCKSRCDISYVHDYNIVNVGLSQQLPRKEK